MNEYFSDHIAHFISSETGLEFLSTSGSSSAGLLWYELVPADIHPNQSFVIRTEVHWRRIEVYFRLGRFAVDLLKSMNSADEVKRALFVSILSKCHDTDAKIEVIVNENRFTFDDDCIWTQSWSSFRFCVSKGMLSINEGNDQNDIRIVEEWTLLVVAAVITLLPLSMESVEEEDPLGFPDGALSRVVRNRYERDRRNRVAALAIHGNTCLGCGIDMAEKYGQFAAGVIEVHHIQPVSEIVSSKRINPRTDLVPLCPNCHSVVHLRNPPYTIDELQGLVLGEV